MRNHTGYRATVGMLAMTAALATVGVPATPVLAAGQGDMTQTIQAAKTSAGHEALAAKYDQEAAAAKAKAAEHRKMGDAYKGQPAVTGGKVAAASAMPEHCASLAKSYDEQAQMYTAMAAGERALAKAVK